MMMCCFLRQQIEVQLWKSQYSSTILANQRQVGREDHLPVEELGVMCSGGVEALKCRRSNS